MNDIANSNVFVVLGRVLLISIAIYTKNVSASQKYWQ